MTKEEKEENIKKAQEKAKKIGHCLCNLVIQCPCKAYESYWVCVCWDKYEE